MKRLLARLAALALAMPCLAAQAGPSLILHPQFQIVQWGSQVTLDLMIAGVKAEDPAAVIGGFDVTLGFDAAVLTLDSVDYDNFLGAPDDTLTETALSSPTTGTTWLRLYSVSLLEVSPDACIFCTGPYLVDLQDDSFRLARLTFDWRGGPGDTTVSFVNAALAGGFGENLAVGALVPAQIQVPEPATPALLGLGLAAMLCLGRRTRARRAGRPVKKLPIGKAALCAAGLATALAAHAQISPRSQFVLTATAEGTLMAYFTDDGSVFSPPVEVASLPEASYGEMAVADFSGDGLLDFVAVDNHSVPLLLFRRTGATTFEQEFIGSVASDPKQVYYISRGQTELGRDYGMGIVPVDVDADGDMDILEAINVEFGPGLFWIAKGNTWLNNGTGQFERMEDTFDFSSIFTGWSLGMSITLGDLDGDGFPDMLASEQSSGSDVPSRVYALRGNGDGTFGAPVHVFTTPHPATFISMGDVNNNGTVDALVGMDDDGDPGQVYVFFGTGDFNFVQAPYEAFDTHEAETGLDAPGGGRFQLVDVDRDGVLDVVASPALAGPVPDALSPARLAWYRGLGDGRFVFATEIEQQIFTHIGFAAPAGTAVNPRLPGDLDGTGGIDFRDVRILMQPSHPAMGPHDPFDLNRDGIVNVADTRRLVLMCTLPRCAFVVGD